MNPAFSNARRPGWQLGLRTLLLAVAVTGVTIVIVKDCRQIPLLQARIAKLRPVAHDLIIDDLAKVAVVRLLELWSGEKQWDVYLPAGTRFRLSVATHGIEPKETAAAAKSIDLTPGRHLIAFEEAIDGNQRGHMAVTCDGKLIVRVDMPPAWIASGYGSSESGTFLETKQFPVTHTVELFDRRYTIDNKTEASQYPDGRCPEFFIRIAPEPAGDRSNAAKADRS